MHNISKLHIIVSKNIFKKKQRVPYLINLGVTNRMVHKHERISVTGRVGLNLISTSTVVMNLSIATLKSIGKLLMLIVDQCIPLTPLHHIFKTTDKYELEYIRLFGQQLCISDENGLDRFCIPGISILINNDLNPHCDTMNPTTSEYDHTLCYSVQIPVGMLPTTLQTSLQYEYKSHIPMCIVLYRRNALTHYSKRMNEVDNYLNMSHSCYSGRMKLITHIRDVSFDNDYIGTFFSKSKRNQVYSKFEYDSRSYCKGKILSLNQSVDKMVGV